MIQQTIFPFKIEATRERLTAHGGAGIDGGIQLRDWVKRAYGPVSTIPWEQSGFQPFSDCGQFGVNVAGRRGEAGRSAGIKTGGGVNEINWAG